jgi:hypothetical protein
VLVCRRPCAPPSHRSSQSVTDHLAAHHPELPMSVRVCGPTGMVGRPRSVLRTSSTVACRHDVGVLDDQMFQYVAWFHDESLPADDEDYEWPGVIFIRAADGGSALAWGNELSKTCADTLVRSTAEPYLEPVRACGVVVSLGERLTAAEIGG